MSLTNPHDRFFKQAFGQPEAVRDFLQHYLPAAVVAVLDVEHPEALPATFVDVVTAGDRATIRGSPAPVPVHRHRPA
ncbi:MAG: hypothetical protein COY42_10810 [Armatimonadetes bacterium CG_4_10_14_0_8_um_filter_66_14]|nr:Rpn family recombination-promoting nuclease/putative transposase [Armatimonadota bacterium]PIU91411.1 MAG: hypothetical protein COS65_22135 [Armatimonadetes bacterium CG06_land_8_20_14_3_00_66_21]PIX49048.1 MAG: hypothetical protein COZ57_04330 [Armatimonadetes bacterium CG_4_8_14_3_um_filter_66_20]PIZ46341.1 MAG: hypothetical protein COY42_10810 [Armatimonadetes bacterium CG_4_10_14_0_8_um_filter_66_14]PJB66520.1 MAG: hypothetical protein CO096_16940 [Armatimonadetes bacterium CG_4_9_14_3_u